MNVLNIIGRCGGDCEVRYTQAGKPVGTFSVAITSGWGDNQKTTWVRCTLFGDRAEKLSPYIHKGDRIGVTGELELQEWQKQDGTTASTVCCMVRDVTLLGEKKASQSTQAPAQQAAGGEFVDETIPF